MIFFKKYQTYRREKRTSYSYGPPMMNGIYM